MVRAASHGRASRFMTLKKSGQVELALCSATVRQEFAKLQETEGVCNNFKMLKNEPVSDLGSASSSQRPQGLDEERDFTYGPTGTQPVQCPECRRPFRLGDHPTPEQCPNCECWFCCHVCRVKHNKRGWCGPGDSQGVRTAIVPALMSLAAEFEPHCACDYEDLLAEAIITSFVRSRVRRM